MIKTNLRTIASEFHEFLRLFPQTQGHAAPLQPHLAPRGVQKSLRNPGAAEVRFSSSEPMI